MSLSTKFYGLALAGLMTSGCATTIGGATVTANPPVDMAGQAHRIVTQARPDYYHVRSINTNPGENGGCRANAQFNPINGSYYLYLDRNELVKLINGETIIDKSHLVGPAHIPTAIGRLYPSQFDPNDLQKALTSLETAMRNNVERNRIARSRYSLCGY